jgi:hypothetical protein
VDAKPHFPGAQLDLPPATRRKRGVFGQKPSVSSPDTSAGRACAAHKGQEGFLGFHRPLSARIFSGKGDGRRTPSPVLQREPFAWQKPLNGALRGVILFQILRGSFQRPVRCLSKPGADTPPGGTRVGRCPSLVDAVTRNTAHAPAKVPPAVFRKSDTALKSLVPLVYR